MVYEVQLIKVGTEGQVTRQMADRARAGWQVVSTCADKNYFIVTWGRPA